MEFWIAVALFALAGALGYVVGRREGKARLPRSYTELLRLLRESRAEAGELRNLLLLYKRHGQEEGN